MVVLTDAREFLARPNNDFAWSSWEDAGAALREMDVFISRIGSGDLPERGRLELMFLPTGPIQEVSLSSGWGEEFLRLAERFDSAIEEAYGNKPCARSKLGRLGILTGSLALAYFTSEAVFPTPNVIGGGAAKMCLLIFLTVIFKLVIELLLDKRGRVKK